MLVLHKCFLWYFFHEFFNFFGRIFNSKVVKIYYIIIILIWSYSVSFYWFILIKIYYICPIFYFRWIISWINTIKLRFVLIILLYLLLRRHLKLWPAVTVSSPALIVAYPWLVAIALLPVNRFPNKLAPKAPNDIPRNPPFCSFT